MDQFRGWQVDDGARNQMAPRPLCLLLVPSPLLSARVEGLFFHRSDQTVEHFVDRSPAGQLLHVVEPPLDIGIGRQVAADNGAERYERGAEIVGDGYLVAAEVLVFRSDAVVVEDSQPPFSVLLPAF